MATNVIMPALGMAQEKGRLIRWLVAPGAAVNKGDPLMEVETDKTTVEIEAPASGTTTNMKSAASRTANLRIWSLFLPNEKLCRSLRPSLIGTGTTAHPCSAQNNSACKRKRDPAVRRGPFHINRTLV